jgi:DNA-binding transcriptional LysR family regulator
MGEGRLAASEVLPVAILERPCRFRDVALAALDAEGRPYRVVLETPSLSVLRAAVDSGLAITCRTRIFSDRVLDAEAAATLPGLPKVAYVRHLRASPHPTIGRLGELMNAAVLDLQPEEPPMKLIA